MQFLLSVTRFVPKHEACYSLLPFKFCIVDDTKVTFVDRSAHGRHRCTYFEPMKRWQSEASPWRRWVWPSFYAYPVTRHVYMRQKLKSCSFPWSAFRVSCRCFLLASYKIMRSDSGTSKFLSWDRSDVLVTNCLGWGIFRKATKRRGIQDFSNKRPGLTLVCCTSLSLSCHGIDVWRWLFQLWKDIAYFVTDWKNIYQIALFRPIVEPRVSIITRYVAAQVAP